jgi:hypothetical protein
VSGRSSYPAHPLEKSAADFKNASIHRLSSLKVNSATSPLRSTKFAPRNSHLAYKDRPYGFRGVWCWFAVVVVQLIFNSVLGEDLLAILGPRGRHPGYVPGRHL